jgi:hypothetical protein
MIPSRSPNSWHAFQNTEKENTTVLNGVNEILARLGLYLDVRYYHSDAHSRMLVKATNSPWFADVCNHFETTSIATSIVRPQQICPQTLVHSVVGARKPPRHRRRPFRVVQVLHGPEV